MEAIMRSLNTLIAGACAAALWSAPASAQAPAEGSVEHLLGELADPEQQGADQIERQIMQEWSKSGSAAMDLLLRRGREAMEEENWEAAIDHLSALTDHAPDFAEGWNARATAFFNTGRWGLAVADIRRTLALNPDHFEAMTGLGIIFAELGDRNAALAVYRQLVQINPHREQVNDALDRLERKVGGDLL
jgi:Flp pilus assembly protein TadD